MVNVASSMDHRRVHPKTKNNVAQHDSHTPANTKSWFTTYIFDVGYPCYDQLTPVKTRFSLTTMTT